MEDISLHKLYGGVTKIIPEPARAAWKVMEVSRRLVEPSQNTLNLQRNIDSFFQHI
jgi:hypothetical protein